MGQDVSVYFFIPYSTPFCNGKFFYFKNLTSEYMVADHFDGRSGENPFAGGNFGVIEIEDVLIFWAICF